MPTNLVLGKKPLLASEYCYATAKGQKALLAQFGEGLKTPENCGEYRRIYDKWLGVYQEEAVAQAEAHPGRIHLLITDVVMPEMNGRELAGNLQIQYPDLKVLFMSGYTANVIAHRGVLDEGVNFIQKPFSNRDLAMKVREALES